MPTRAITSAVAVVLLLSLEAAAIELRPTADAWAQPVVVDASLRVTGGLTGERAAAKGSPPTPIEVEAVLGYSQQGLPSDAGLPRVARVADSAEAGLLREDRRLLVARVGETGATVAAVDGPLRRTELDRVQWAADPLVIDQLLPTESVRQGSTWRVSGADARRLMGLDSATLAEVTAILTDVTRTHARFRFAGPVHGINDGAKTELDVRGVGLFDRRSGRVTRLNLAWSEKRELGPATPALQATAKLNVTIRPADEGERLSAEQVARAAAAAIDERLLIEATDRSWSLLAGRDWFVVGGDRRLTTLRQVDADGARAQTTIMRRDGAAMPLDEFEREVRYSLGEGLDRVVATAEGVTATGLTRRSIESTGQIAGQPTRWRHHQLAASGGGLVVTTTIPVGDGSEPSGDRLVDAIRLRDAALETASAGAGPTRR